MVEYESLRADGVSKMIGSEQLRQQVDKLSIMSGRDHHMRLGSRGTGYQFAEDRLARGDPRNGIRPAKQFVQPGVSA
jgi:hypothetical protein